MPKTYFSGECKLARFWIFVVSEENWFVIKEGRVHGVPDGSKAVDLVKPGDVAIFYVKKRDARSLGGKFVGAFRVTSSWFREDKPLWPDEVREGRVKYPWRVRLEPIKLGVADFDELVPKLSFIGNKERAYAYLVGTPANLKRPIPEEDAKLIIDF